MPKFFMFLGYWIGRFSQEEKRAHVHVIKCPCDKIQFMRGDEDLA
jgi:hypothetical protein